MEKQKIELTNEEAEQLFFAIKSQIKKYDNYMQYNLVHKLMTSYNKNSEAKKKLIALNAKIEKFMK